MYKKINEISTPREAITSVLIGGAFGKFLSRFLGKALVSRIGSFFSKGGAGKVQINKINPTGGNVNCANCSIATDATLKGRPATALNGNVTSITELANALGSKNGFLKTGGTKDITNFLLKKGNGSTGIVFGSRGPGRVGHFFNAVNQNGKIRFLDGQTGRSASLGSYKSLQFMDTTGL